MFDVDGDLVLSNQEVLDMLSILCEVANEHARNSSRASTPEGEPAEPWNAGSMLATLAGRMKAKADCEEVSLLRILGTMYWIICCSPYLRNCSMGNRLYHGTRVELEG